MRRTLAVLAAAVVAVLGLAAPAPAGDLELPPLFTAEGDPPGANDWSCVPTAEHPTPVILVHGTFGDRKHLLERLSKKVHEAGFCVFSLDYGNRATRDIRQSAQELADHTQRVLAATGAAKVSMVGHSQGGMMPRYYLKFLGGDQYVEDLVGVAPSNQGGTGFTSGANVDNPVSELVGQLCQACLQQNPGSEFMTELNAGDQTPGEVSYTQIATRYDELVQPVSNAFLTPGPNTTNLVIQDICRLDLAEHLLIPSSPTTIRIVLDALNRPGPARQDFPRGCKFN